MKIFILISLLLAFSTCLYADGGETRPATQAEKLYQRRVLETIREAMPESFAGFKLVNATEPYESEDMDAGTEKWPLGINFNGTWVNDTLQQEANQKMQEIADSMTGDIGKSPKMQALMKKKEQIEAKMEQAAKNNDIDAIGRLGQEFEAVAKEIDKGYAPAVNAIPTEDYYEVKVSIGVNELTAELSKSIHKENAPVQGFKTFYYHDNEEGETKRADSVMIYAGNWSCTVDNGVYMLKLNRKDVPHTTVQSYVINVTGKKEYTQKFMDNIKWDVLKGIMK
jgi:hypothetical protein